MKTSLGLLGTLALSIICSAAPAPPTWVGAAAHTWSPRLGGGMWFQQGAVVSGIAPAMAEYSRPVLVGLRSDSKEFGYRFDWNSWAAAPAACRPDFPDKFYQEKVMQTMLAVGNVEFIWSMPTPNQYSATPYSYGGPTGEECYETPYSYPWQKPEYYAAYLQYLIGQTTMTPTQYGALNTTYGFYTDDSATTINTASEAAVGNNWANLRAKRGHPAPYTLVAVILGVEPWGTAQEGYDHAGSTYGQRAELFRAAIRARGTVTPIMSTIPLGLAVEANYPMTHTDGTRPWFDPMMGAVTKSDFSYLDLYHHYRIPSASDEEKRVYPIASNTTPVNIPAGILSPGWQYYWLNTSQWRGVNYSKFLWMYDDARLALSDLSEDPNRWKLGVAEHGLSVVSPNLYGNDMGAALHWAHWLAEVMRYNSVWDMNWVLGEQGFSHAQLHYRNSRLTRTPGHYVHRLAQEFYGLEYRENTFSSPTWTTGTIDGGNYRADDVTVRVFRDPTSGNYHLFVVNKHPNNAATITGWESWYVKKWTRINANNYTDRNRIGEDDPLGAWIPETVRTVSATHTFGQSLSIPKLSVNHIELTATQPTLPSVTVERIADAKETPQVLGKFRITRTGSTSSALTVNYFFRGTAIGPSPSMDYTIGVGSNTSVTIPAGNAFIDVEVWAWYDYPENPEYVTMILSPSSSYLMGAPDTATVYIFD